MPYRADVREVKELVNTSAEDEAVRHNFIKTANVFVDANLLSSGLSADVLIEIEKYLAAHFLALAEEKTGLIRETVGPATDEYSENTAIDEGLRSTRFGQQAIVLDTTGTLANLATPKKRAEFRVL